MLQCWLPQIHSILSPPTTNTFHIITADCPKRPVTCVHCHKEMAMELIDEHLVTCNERLFTCYCNQVLKFIDFHQHKQQTCPMTLIDCPLTAKLRECGSNYVCCRKQVARRNIANHLSREGGKPEVLQALFAHIDALTLQLGQTKSEPTKQAAATVPKNEIKAPVEASSLKATPEQSNEEQEEEDEDDLGFTVWCTRNKTPRQQQQQKESQPRIKTVSSASAIPTSFKFPQGDYDGEMKMGPDRTYICHGHGTMKYRRGDSYHAVYVGEFKNHEKDGYGVLTFPAGNTYSGDFVAGKRSGKGC